MPAATTQRRFWRINMTLATNYFLLLEIFDRSFCGAVMRNAGFHARKWLTVNRMSRPFRVLL
jgi:hypothetical protein